MILAIDIGGTKHSVALVGADGKVHQEATAPTDRNAGAVPIVNSLLRRSKRLLHNIKGVTACGIGFGGPVDFAAQRILSSTHVAGWDQVDLVAVIKAELGLPALIENDANAGALGEFTFGAGKGCESLVYYTVSTGIGGGIILNGGIFRGSNGSAGELGHVPIRPEDGPICDCGNRGCLESLCSGPSIVRRAEGKIGGMSARAGQLTAKDVFDAARSGDQGALAVVDETCTYLAMGVAGVMNTLAPSVIVVGGGVARAGDVLFAPLRQKALAYVMAVHRSSLDVRPAELGDRSVLLGAAALASHWANGRPAR